jgi:hypothetical protein
LWAKSRSATRWINTLSHYHAERNHQGLENRLIEPEADVGNRDGPIACRERLGGLLKYGPFGKKWNIAI